MQSDDFYVCVISANYPQAAGSHGPHRPSACITTYPHPRQPFSPVLRVADRPNLRDPTAGCNLHPAWNEAMCTIGPDSRDGEAKGRRRVKGEPRSRKPVLTPLASPSFPSSCREQGYFRSRIAMSAEGGKKERPRRETRGKKKEKESTADAGSLPGAC